MKSKETQLVYLQRRVAALTKMVQQRDMMIDTLVRDIDLTESVGCAFAFDLAMKHEAVTYDMEGWWDEALAGAK